MRGISDTIARLAAAADRMSTVQEVSATTRLLPLTTFGSNPGALRGFALVPDDRTPDIRRGMPLVVVLHGCTQTAGGYDRGSGWSELADRFGFALLFPEQVRANNSNLCFNWFVPEDTSRDSGEAASIRQMVAAMVDRHAIDPTRVFVTGLSAGGAMASVMLAAYPEVFAGGAIIAGLPYGAASSMPQAFDRMRGHGHVSDDIGASAIRSASRTQGTWPSVSVWHGDADQTVNAVNADRIVGQWRSLRGIAATPDREEQIDGALHRIWESPEGAIQIEEYRIARMGHGTPIRTDGKTACGTAMPFMLDAGISSTWHIAHSWGLLNVEADSKREIEDAVPTAPTPPPILRSPTSPPPPPGIQATIETALRAAGLMR